MTRPPPPIMPRPRRRNSEPPPAEVCPVEADIERPRALVEAEAEWSAFVGRTLDDHERLEVTP